MTPSHDDITAVISVLAMDVDDELGTVQYEALGYDPDKFSYCGPPTLKEVKRRAAEKLSWWLHDAMNKKSEG